MRPARADDLDDLKLLLNHVKDSTALVLLQTKGVLTRPWVILELYTAITNQVPVVSLNVMNAFPYDYGDAEELLTFLDEDLDRVNPGAADLLRKQGVDLVTVQTSNAMFLGTAQLEQQWVITRARAAEVGRSVVVSSINGLSGAIGPDGRVIEQLPSRESTSSLVEVPMATGMSIAVRFGPWPGRVAGLLTVVAVAAAVRRQLSLPGES